MQLTSDENSVVLNHSDTFTDPIHAPESDTTINAEQIRSIISEITASAAYKQVCWAADAGLVPPDLPRLYLTGRIAELINKPPNPSKLRVTESPNTQQRSLLPLVVNAPAYFFCTPSDLPSKKIRDYAILNMKWDGLACRFDSDLYLNTIGVPYGNRSAYYAKIETRLRLLRDIILREDDPSLRNPLTWLTQVQRIDNSRSATGREFLLRFHPRLRPILLARLELLCKAQPYLWRLQSNYAYELYFRLLESADQRTVQFRIDDILSWTEKCRADFTRSSTLLKIAIRDPIQEICDKTDLNISYRFGHKPIRTVTFCFH